MREIFLELTGMHKSFFSAVRELYSLCDSERDAAKARTGGNLRGEQRDSLSCHRERRALARERTLSHEVRRFFKELPPRPFFASFASRRKEGGTLRSLRAKEPTRTELTFAVASLSRGGGPRVHSGARPG